MTLLAAPDRVNVRDSREKWPAGSPIVIFSASMSRAQLG